MLRDHSSSLGLFVIVGFGAIEGFVLTLWMTLMTTLIGVIGGLRFTWPATALV
jgi:hypothetical protein